MAALIDTLSWVLLTLGGLSVLIGGIGALRQVPHRRQGAVDQRLDPEVEHDIKARELVAGDLAQIDRLLAGPEAETEFTEMTGEGYRLGLQPWRGAGCSAVVGDQQKAAKPRLQALRRGRSLGRRAYPAPVRPTGRPLRE